jgi:hypothetical protein
MIGFTRRSVVAALLVSILSLFAIRSQAQMCQNVPHVECRVCDHDAVPLSDQFIAAQFCTTGERQARYALLDAGQKESAIMTVLNLSDGRRFVLVWKPRVGDPDSQVYPWYRGIAVKAFGSSDADLAMADYKYLTLWGWNAALVSTNDPNQPFLTVAEIDIRCGGYQTSCPPPVDEVAPPRRRASGH